MDARKTRPHAERKTEKGPHLRASSGAVVPGRSLDRPFPALATWLPPNQAVRVSEGRGSPLRAVDAIPCRLRNKQGLCQRRHFL